jgi:tRNA(Arg) A34 adenosine deaminase TadA
MNKKILRECLRMARDKNRPEVHPEWGNFLHYSVIVQNNKIIEMGFNRSIHKGALRHLGYSDESKIHSEVDAYNKAKGHPDFDFNDPFEVVNMRLNRQGDMRMSKPCSCCHNFLNTLGAKGCYFTTDVGWAKLGF